MVATLAHLADIAGAKLHGDADCQIIAVNTLNRAKTGDIAFLANPCYASQLPKTNASAVILSKQDVLNCPTNALVSKNPHLTYARVANYLYPRSEARHDGSVDKTASIGKGCNIEPSVCIAANAVIGDNVNIAGSSYIGPGCIIDADVSIGVHSILTANVTLRKGVVIGESAVIHPGAVIGADGFGMAPEENGCWLTIPQIGSVRIGNNVHIGANTTIDRGAIEDTVIGDGVKIDNLVQIAHNVTIGEHTAIAGCVGIAGSTVIGKRCRLAGAVGVAGHIEIVDDVTIYGMSAVTNSIKKAGVYSSCLPVTESTIWRRNIVRFKKLDVILKKLEQLISIKR